MEKVKSPERDPQKDIDITTEYAVQFPNGYVLPMAGYLTLIAYWQQAMHREDLQLVTRTVVAGPWRSIPEPPTVIEHEQSESPAALRSVPLEDLDAILATRSEDTDTERRRNGVAAQ
jgi:hypothetical protein